MTNTEISIVTLTHPIGTPDTLRSPVIHPSLGPGPRLAVRYIALPMPISRIPKQTWRKDTRMSSEAGIRSTVSSIVAAIIMALSRVPIPGTSLIGIQSRSTAALTKKVAFPIDQPITVAIPSARTVHGVFPTPATIRNASPKPKRNSPTNRIARVGSLGRVDIGLLELHRVVGTFFAGRSNSHPPIGQRWTIQPSTQLVKSVLESAFQARICGVS